MKSITLTTLNARYIHASLGLRYLLANMRELLPSTRLAEFTLDHRPEDIVEDLLSFAPDSQLPTARHNLPPTIFGFGVYIWNVTETTEVIQLLKTVCPECIVVIGGPEVSHEYSEQPIVALADHVIIGQADLAFAQLCREIHAGERPSRFVSSLPFELGDLASPYPWYSEEDLAHRVVYVEASRGCPFKCEFCLSSLDKTAVPFDLAEFLKDMQDLIDRGARQFKFVDRTFNLRADTGRQILEFFGSHRDKNLFLHFELIPDRLPETLRELLPEWAPGSLQFEIGIQSFNPDVQRLISRRQDHQKTCDNMSWLVQQTQAHIHADLIFGLPGETLESFGRGFDLLYSLAPQEIQVGLLKRLRGTPIARHTEQYAMRYAPTPPYRVLSTADADFPTVQRMVRFARYWDLIGNSGRFPQTLPLLTAGQPFERFMRFSDWLFATHGQTHRIALPRLFELLLQGVPLLPETCADAVLNALTSDYRHNRLKGQPRWLPSGPVTRERKNKANRRQQRHLPRTSEV